MSDSLTHRLKALSSAEDFLTFFGVPFDEKVVHVNRLHILKRFYQYLHKSEAVPGEDEVATFRRYRELLIQAHGDFVNSSAVKEKVYQFGGRVTMGARYDTQVKALSYELTDPTLDSVLVQLLSGPVDALISGVTGKFGAMVIRKASDMGFKGAHYIATGVSSIQEVLVPAGADRATGVMSTTYAKDPSDPALADDLGIKAYRAFMARWYPEGNADDSFNSYGYMTAMVTTRVLQQCNGDFSRRNIMAQANNLKDLDNPILLPGIKINTSPTDHRPLEQMQLQRFDGKRWVRFGPVFEGSAV